ncbi:complex I subunit 1/NuoH family protein [Eisenibacter elegans]|jgi:NADH-quinone oxidoreductase subunit H|uniref:complex I subunit 1/NuoH family protein n=1 Tax=Eisenibacter elegans TaxID=997 RepID=UPI00041703D2|nr:complex I subunit 1 family protein [Eisenibacter elegans]
MTTLLIFLPFLVVFGLAAVYAERKISAYIQDRMGPMEVGPRGLLQTVADILKLLQKEDITPQGADKWLFTLAPILIFTVIFAGFAVIPLAPELVGSAAYVGVFYLLAIISLDVIGLLMAGWASASKFPIIGAMRAVAQIVSYEIPAGLAILSVVMICQTLDLQEISYQQGIWATYTAPGSRQYLFGLPALGIDITGVGGFLAWNIVRMPLLSVAFLIYFIAALAECNRAPFDIPEAESELIGGYHTEYSGLKFAFFFLSEYGMMILLCLLMSVLFLGGWNTPLPNIGPVALANWTSGTPGTWFGYLSGAFWMLSKALVLFFVQMWVRWVYPRLRVDQLMYLCWKVLVPFALAIVLACGVWRLWMVG